MASLPSPSLISPDDVTIPSADGTGLKGWLWRSPSPRGILIISHGLGEHAGIYRSLAEYLVPTVSMDVLGIDFIGHGRSPGRRGLVARFDQLTENLTGAIEWASRERPDLPRFVLGHSNGGLVAAMAMLGKPGSVDGLILSNPAFRLKYRPPAHKVTLGHVLRVVAPWVTLAGPLPTDGLSRDPLQRLLFQSDRLIHTRICAPLFFGMRDGGDLALDRAAELDLPLLLILGPDDPIIDPEVGLAFFERFGGPDKTLLAPPGFRHDPLFERDRGRIYGAIAEWLIARPSPESRGNGEPSGPTFLQREPADRQVR